MYTFVRNLKEHEGKDVELKGWLTNKRFSGKIGFLQLRDGSGFIQAVVAKADFSDAIWEKIQALQIESSISIKGKVTKHPKQGIFELQTKEINIISESVDYPIGNKDHGPDFLLTNRHLWLRSSKQWAIQRVRNIVINATYEYLNREGFIKIDSPILTPAACEGTSTLFEVPYFDIGKAYLSQSGQLYIEAAIMSFGRVFDFGPVFRAEKSKTRRHLTEFWMMDAEAAFVEHDENLKIQEGLVCHIVKKVLELGQEELKIMERDVKALEKVVAPFPRVTHADAVAMLHKLGSDIKDDDDLGGDDETLIMKEYASPLFIEKYPAAVKAFYMKRDPANPALALCADLIAPEGFGEIIGGSQREDDYATLVARIKEHNLPVEAFDWYLDLRKYGSVPHSGFGYGLERIVGWMCGTPHIRETIPFPRMLNRIYP